jgi:putative ABC transport system substrate-binding protein
LKKVDWFSIFVTTALLTFSVRTEAQQPKRIPMIGYLAASSTATVNINALRQGLRELGYVEGKTITIEYRFAEGKLDRLHDLVAELVRLKVDVIVTGGGTSTRAAKDATATIPIVMTQGDDPIGSGFVVSLARPGGNVTGLSAMSTDLSGKRLELLKEIVPKLSRVAVLVGQVQQTNPAQMKEIEVSAHALGLQLQILPLLAPKDIEAAFQTATNGRAGAVLAETAAPLLFQRTHVAELAVKNRLPVIYTREEFVEAGGLMVYAPNLTDLSRRAASYVDKILKGANTADLPVEQPKKFEFIVNLKAAKQINLTIPPNVLGRADRVIK